MVANKLFNRKVDPHRYQEYLNIVNNITLPETLAKFRKKNLLALMIDGYDDECLAYRFSILREWINKNENLSTSFSNQLENNIKRLGLSSYLNAEENNYVYHTQSYVFSLSRNIKSLIVNFQLFDGEEAYFHYDFVNVRTANSKLIFKGELYITNKRIIFSDDIYVYWLNVDNISKIYDVNDVIYIKYLDKLIYFQFPDSKLFRLSFDKMCKITKRTLSYDQ